MCLFLFGALISLFAGLIAVAFGLDLLLAANLVGLGINLSLFAGVAVALDRGEIK